MKTTHNASKCNKSPKSGYGKSSTPGRGKECGRAGDFGMAAQNTGPDGGTDFPGAEFDNADGPESAGTQDAIWIYIREIRQTPLLSKEQEAHLGRSIREGFEALQQHVLKSGYVLESLLSRVDAELAKKTCRGQRKAALEIALSAGRPALLRARECAAAGLPIRPELWAEIERTFTGIIAALELWPNSGVELLDLLASRHAIEDRAIAASGKAGSTDWQPAFSVANLMGHEECRGFIREGQRLKKVALARRNQLVNANLRLVVSVSKKMKHAFLSREDLIQEGNFGLVTAAERFDERLGNRFSTFAVNLIKTAMRRENDNQGRTIRLPVHRCEALRQVEQARVALEHDLRRAPSPGELAEQTGLKLDDVLELSVLREGTVSIHGPAGEDVDATLEKFVADPLSLKPFYAEPDPAGCFDAQLCTLEEGQRRVIACLYGLGGSPRLSPAETAVLLGITAAAVTRLHRLALEAIRAGVEAEPGFSVRAA